MLSNLVRKTSGKMTAARALFLRKIQRSRSDAGSFMLKRPVQSLCSMSCSLMLGILLSYNQNEAFAAPNFFWNPIEPAASHRPKVTIAVIGDSITRGVLANTNLGGTAQFQDYILVAQLTLGPQSVALIPEAEGALNWKLMKKNEVLARDHLAAVQGEKTYSLVNRFARRGQELEVITFAQLGGSYRTAEGQIALLQSELLRRHARGEDDIDAILVDLGRIDFSFFTQTADFQSQVDSFFRKLRQVAPRTRILVTRIAEIPSILDRPDRVGMYLLGGKPVYCSEIFRDKIATKTRLVPGQDNSPWIGSAKTRWQEMNQILSKKVATLQEEGTTAAWVNILPDRNNPETWDDVLAADCIHINEKGQEQIANVLESELIKLLAQPESLPLHVPQDHHVGNHPMDHAGDHAEWSPQADLLWQEYLHSLHGHNIQKGCEPRLWKENGPLKGTALLYHGFTACPQQYDELAQQLAAHGYRVVVPLLPGHGRQWSINEDGSKTDDIRFLPQGILSKPYSYQKEYLDFVGQMNTLFSKVKGPRTVVGLSAGASLATLATILRADLWDRQLLLSPLYEIGQAPMRTLFGSISNTQRQLRDLLSFWSPILDQDAGWGQGCENERDPNYVARYGRSELRAGICQFKITHAAASNQIGYEAWETIRPTMVKTQIIGVAQDPIVNKNLIFNSAGKFRNENMGVLPYTTEERVDDHPNVRVCYLPNDNSICVKNASLPLDKQQKPCINHSLLSRFDSPYQNKYWINTINQKIINFIDQDEFFPSDNFERVHSDPLCRDF